MILQQPIAREQMAKLLASGATDLLEGFVSNKTRRKFKARLAWDDKEGKVVFAFEPRPGRPPAKRAGSGGARAAAKPAKAVEPSRRLDRGPGGNGEEGAGEEGRRREDGDEEDGGEEGGARKDRSEESRLRGKSGKRRSIVGESEMIRPSSLRLAQAAAIVGLAGLSLLATAAPPDAKKPERRVPPTGAQMSEIPAGVDSGTPSTSNSMQLGMPVPPSQQAADQAEQNRRSSAAARAAARPSSVGGEQCLRQADRSGRHHRAEEAGNDVDHDLGRPGQAGGLDAAPLSAR